MDGKTGPAIVSKPMNDGIAPTWHCCECFKMSQELTTAYDYEHMALHMAQDVLIDASLKDEESKQLAKTVIKKFLTEYLDAKG